MNPNDVHFADSTEILKRKSALDRFVERLFEPELRPCFVSDEANMFDISAESTEEIVNSIRKQYGMTVTAEQLRMPVWKLLDLLEGSSGVT